MDYTNWITQMLKGCGLTAELFIITIICSVPLGLILTFLYTGKSKLCECVIKRIIGFYVLVFRGTPLLLQIFFIFYGLPFLPYIGKYLVISDRFTAGAIAFVLNYTAYYEEIFRGGLISVDKGQYEAAKVLGVGPVKTKLKIVLPQMLRISLPAATNEAIVLLKDTALISTLGLSDLLQVTNGIVNRTTNVLPFAFAAAIYLILSYVLSILFKHIEKKFDF